MRWCNVHSCYDKFCCATPSPQQQAERVGGAFVDANFRPPEDSTDRLRKGDRIDVSATVRDEEDHADAAYDLCLENVTPATFCAKLLATLQSDWGLTHQAGTATLTLTITITRTETAK